MKEIIATFSLFNFIMHQIPELFAVALMEMRKFYYHIRPMSASFEDLYESVSFDDIAVRFKTKSNQVNNGL